MNRRTLLKGFVAGAAGLLLPEAVAAEPERRVWAFPRNPLDKSLYMADLAATLRSLWAETSISAQPFINGDMVISYDPAHGPGTILCWDGGRFRYLNAPNAPSLGDGVHLSAAGESHIRRITIPSDLLRSVGD